MSMADYELAKAIVSAHKTKAQFAGPRSEELVKAAEDALGVSFPPTYQRFLLEYGAGSFGWVEFYGVINSDFVNSSVPDAIWSTLTQRQRVKLPREFVIVGDTGTGELYALDLSVSSGPVVVVDPGAANPKREDVAEDFGAFFFQHVQQVA